MRRVMPLALLALALPMAVSADQVRYNTGVPATAAIASMTSFTNPFMVDVSCFGTACSPVTGQISPVEISLTTTSTFVGDCSSFCTFMDGNVTVTDSGGNRLFRDTVSNGQIVAGSIISADVNPWSLCSANCGDVNFGIIFTGTAATGGNGSMILDNVVPEPGTFVMLGTGLIGLGGIAIRKLRLGP